MQSVNYWEAWSHWWSGQRLDSFSMAGLPFTWWGRIGKILQFIAGLLVVLDLIGKSRLNSAVGKVEAAAHGVTLRALIAHLTAGSARPGESPLRPLRGAITIIMTAFLVPFVMLLVVAYVFLLRHVDGLLFGALRILAVGLAFVVAAGLAPSTVAFLARVLPLPLRGLAWLLGAGDAGHPLRWVAFIAVVVGFQFDLLAG